MVRGDIRGIVVLYDEDDTVYILVNTSSGFWCVFPSFSLVCIPDLKHAQHKDKLSCFLFWELTLLVYGLCWLAISHL